MSQRKKEIRDKFNRVCKARDKGCVLCPSINKTSPDLLEVHHIMSRKDMPGGGYVLENGVTLCPRHHEMAEGGYPSQRKLFAHIGSTYQEALDASNRLC